VSPRTPLLKPHEYFTATERPLETGIGVLVSHYVADMVVFFFVAQLILRQVTDLPSGVSDWLTRLLVITALVAIFVYALAWLIVAGVMHVWLGGRESEAAFRDALAVAGWSYAPEVLTAPLALAIAWNQLRDLALDGSDPERLSEQIEAAESLTTDPLGIALLLFITAWSIYILARGTAATHDVPASEAFLPALFVGIGSILLAIAF